MAVTPKTTKHCVPHPPRELTGEIVVRKEKTHDDDRGAVPRLRVPSPLQRHDQSRDAAQDQDPADPVHPLRLRDERLERTVGLVGSERRGGFEGEEDDGGCNASDRQVDVEAPPPSDVVGEGLVTADQRQRW